MLGDVSPQTIRITAQAVVYPGRDHVVRVTVEKVSGQRYVPTDLTAITRAVVVFPETDPTIAYDSLVDPVFDFTAGGGVLEIDLSDYAMPASIYESHLVLFDAEHTGGQVIVDNDDTKLVFDFRNVSTTGTTPPPSVEFITDAPIDGELYGRQDGGWVPISDVVAGVLSVNGQTGVVVLDAADVGADPAGTGATEAASAVAAHVADTTPHTTILSLDRVGFSLTPTGPAGVGEIVWNDTDKTLDLGLPDGVTLQAGQEVQVRGLNNSGSTMLNGQAVYISGASGNRLVFSRAQANQITADKTLAVLTQDILNNQQGQATVIGLVRGLNTSGFAEGAELWVSATVLGGLTQTKPAPPNNAVRVGFCVRSHATLGSIFVRVQNIEMLSDLHDLNIIAPQDGDIIEYDSGTSTWINVPNTGGSGEANTASNLGAGTGVFAGKVAADLQFKSFVQGTGITITSTATEITINSSGGSGAVDSVNGQTGVVVLDTDDIAEGVTNLYFTNGRAAAAAPVQSVDGQTGTVSLSASYAPLSHVGDTGAAHGNATTTVAGFMSGADKTKLDGIAAGAQVNVPTNLAAGVAATTVLITSSTGDDATIPAATVSAAGVMTGADKTKLDGIATGATANSSDAFLLDRTNHTGTQAISTVTGLQTALDKALYAPVLTESTTARVLALTDGAAYIRHTNASASTVTVPPQSSVAWLADTEIHIRRAAAGDLTLTPGSGVTLNAPSGGTLVMTNNMSVTIKRVASDVWDVIGQTVAV